jgi:curved DNA-binding protein CbpA
VSKRDPQGYYAALNLSPDATAAEIRLAYNFIKQSYQEQRRQIDIGKIRSAYEVLSDPRARRRYDRGETDGSDPMAWIRSIKPRQVLVPLLCVSLVVFLFLVGPSLRAQFRSFEPGDQVYWVENDEDLGKILSFDREHRFPSGAVVPAFEVLPASGESPVWYPARDLKRYGRAR